jgi:Ca-activated chloride channel family protein
MKKRQGTAARQFFVAVGMACAVMWLGAPAKTLNSERAIPKREGRIAEGTAGAALPPSKVAPFRRDAMADEILRCVPAGRDSAQNDKWTEQERQQEQIPTIRREVRLVLVEATVKDKGGKVMKILKKEDFQVYEDGQPQEIAHFSQDQLPLAVAMAVDLSGSIKPFLRPLRYASVAALKALKGEDAVALFTFSTEVDRRVELTKDKLAVSDQIESFEAGGGTNINGALYDAARYLREEAPAARRVIVLVSDNVPTVASIRAGEVLDEALEADAAIYGLKVPGRNPPLAAMGARMASHGSFVNVKHVTEETGGEILEVEKEGSLFLAFQALIERLKTRYTLGFYPTKKTQDGKLRKIEVRLQPSFGAKGKDYTIVAKKGYYPATK